MSECRTTDVELMKEFLSSAQAFLPYLGKKPHVLVLDHPMDLVKMYHKEVSQCAAASGRAG